MGQIKKNLENCDDRLVGLKRPLIYALILIIFFMGSVHPQEFGINYGWYENVNPFEGKGISDGPTYHHALGIDFYFDGFFGEPRNYESEDYKRQKKLLRG